MQIELEDRETGGRYFIRTDDGEAEMTFSKTGDRIIIIDHTEMPKAMRHRGFGEALIVRVIADMRAQGKKIVPLCPFAASQFRRHPEWADMLDR